MGTPYRPCLPRFLACQRPIYRPPPRPRLITLRGAEPPLGYPACGHSWYPTAIPFTPFPVPVRWPIRRVQQLATIPARHHPLTASPTFFTLPAVEVPRARS